MVTLTGWVISEGLLQDQPTPSIRLASPEEAAAAAGPAPADTVAPDRRDAGPEGTRASEVLSSEEVTPEPQADAALAPLPSPTEPQYPAPAVGEEPAVAVAEALGPSVVLVEIESSSEFGFGLGSGIVWDAENGYIVTN